MPAIEVGRLCVKLTGREAGKKCVVVDVMDKSFILITGPQSVSGVRTRRVNMNHIEPLEASVEIKRGASDNDVASVLKKAGKLEDMTRPVSPKLP
jgi:large subunit ribosomal protein L14e